MRICVLEVMGVEVIRGESELLLTAKKTEGGVVIRRALSADRTAVLPKTLWGLPVTALEHHAFAPDRPAPEGETVRIACGPVSAEQPDNSHLEDVTLPPTLRRIGDYAFYNCTALKTLRMHDSVTDWGGLVFMNCRKLDTLFLQLTDERARALSYFADELSRELDVTLTDTRGSAARLIFPEYREHLDENYSAHHFDYTITGGGYPYHHCFRDHVFTAVRFDMLWDKYLTTQHDQLTALRLAWWRLRQPWALSAEAGKAYMTYLRDHGENALAWLLEQRDTEGLNWLLGNVALSREALSAGCELARQRNAAEAQALLLEQMHRLAPAGRRKTFDL